MSGNELGPVLAVAVIALVIVRNALFLRPSPQRTKSKDAGKKLR